MRLRTPACWQVSQHRPLFLAIALLVALGTHAQAHTYTLTDLGPHQVSGISATGAIAGSTVQNASHVAVLWSRHTHKEPQALGMLPGGNFSRGNGINSWHQVVGYSSTGPYGLHTHAFAWDRWGGMHSLGTLAGDELFSAANATNDTATIVGYGDDPLGQGTVPIIWIAGISTELPTLGGEQGVAQAIAEDGTIVGSSQTSAGIYHATLWHIDGRVQDLHPDGWAGTSWARSISTAGLVVGVLELPRSMRGFAWQSDTLQVLEPLDGHGGSQAFAANRRGHIVGSSAPVETGFRPPPPHGVLWKDGVAYDLNTRLAPQFQHWHITQAIGITDHGRILAYGRVNNEVRAVVLTPCWRRCR